MATTAFARANICSISTSPATAEPIRASHQRLPTNMECAVSLLSHLGMVTKQNKGEIGAPHSAVLLKPPSQEQQPSPGSWQALLKIRSWFHCPELLSTSTLHGVLGTMGTQTGSCWLPTTGSCQQVLGCVDKPTGHAKCPALWERAASSPRASQLGGQSLKTELPRGPQLHQAPWGGCEHPGEGGCCRHGGCMPARNHIWPGRGTPGRHTCSNTPCKETHCTMGVCRQGLPAPSERSPFSPAACMLPTTKPLPTTPGLLAAPWEPS